MNDKESEDKGQVWAHLSHHCYSKYLCSLGREHKSGGGRAEGSSLSVLRRGSPVWYLDSYLADTDIGHLPAPEEKQKWLITTVLLSHKIAVCESVFSPMSSASSVL